MEHMKQLKVLDLRKITDEERRQVGNSSSGFNSFCQAIPASVIYRLQPL